MSARISQILEVIEQVKENFQIKNKYTSIKRLRINASHAVADRRAIDYRSVIDKFMRQLEPEINTTSKFDHYLKLWLEEGKEDLYKIVLNHSYSNRDKELIEDAFYIINDNESYLLDEFDLNPSDIEFKEGKNQLKIHIAKERNRYLVERAKAKWDKESNGNIKCFVCQFSFLDKYGDIGAGYIEAHHITPISSLTSESLFKLEDLIPVCSNCHSIIHRDKNNLSHLKLKEMVVVANFSK